MVGGLPGVGDGFIDTRMGRDLLPYLAELPIWFKFNLLWPSDYDRRSRTNASSGASLDFTVSLVASWVVPDDEHLFLKCPRLYYIWYSHEGSKG